VVDGSKCISYFTIELKDQMPANLTGDFQNWIFGCDICQDVCPWNRFAKPNQEPRFEPNAFFNTAKKAEWVEITEEVFDQVFDKSPLKRSQYKGLKRNIQFQTEAPEK